jgi:large subunit ribosomal protein L25
VQLVAGSKKYTALIKSATFEPRKNTLTHVVFNAVNRNQKVEAEIPVRPRYGEGNDSTPAERAGLIVLEQVPAVTVRATADCLPDVLEYDAERLVAEGDQITVADLLAPRGVDIVTETEQVLATVFAPSALAAANVAAGGTVDEGVSVAETEPAEGEAGKVA